MENLDTVINFAIDSIRNQHPEKTIQWDYIDNTVREAFEGMQIERKNDELGFAASVVYIELEKEHGYSIQHVEVA